MTITQRQGAHAHIKWLDLQANGLMVECAIMKEDPQGNIYYFELGSLDAVDKGRMARMLQNRNSTSFPLWDLMAQTTLNNGVNALTYFHQLVKIISPDGIVYSPKGGVVGTSTRAGTVQLDTEGSPDDGVQQANPTVTENK